MTIVKTKILSSVFINQLTDFDLKLYYFCIIHQEYLEYNISFRLKIVIWLLLLIKHGYFLSVSNWYHISLFDSLRMMFFHYAIILDICICVIYSIVVLSFYSFGAIGIYWLVADSVMLFSFSFTWVLVF